MELVASVKTGWRAFLQTRLARKKLACAESEGAALQCLPSVDVAWGGQRVDLGRVVGPQYLATMHDPQGMRLVAQRGDAGRVHEADSKTGGRVEEMPRVMLGGSHSTVVVAVGGPCRQARSESPCRYDHSLERGVVAQDCQGGVMLESGAQSRTLKPRPHNVGMGRSNSADGGSMHGSASPTARDRVGPRSMPTHGGIHPTRSTKVCTVGGPTTKRNGGSYSGQGLQLLEFMITAICRQQQCMRVSTSKQSERTREP